MKTKIDLKDKALNELIRKLADEEIEKALKNCSNKEIEPKCEQSETVTNISESVTNKIIRIPFEHRMAVAEKELKENYNTLKNEIMAYGVNSRISNSGDTFRLHCKTYVKISIAGKGLKLYFALKPKDYKNSTIPVSDASEKGIYKEIPLVFKVKSPLSVKRAISLIEDCMKKDNLSKKANYKDVDWAKQFKK